jgi:hypothetical protein
MSESVTSSEPSSSPYSSQDEAEHGEAEHGEAGPSTSRKRKTAANNLRKSKKQRVSSARRKAAAVGINLDMVCSHPKIAYLRQCIGSINSSEKTGKKLSKKGTKPMLLNRIFDFFDMPKDERAPIPVSTQQQQHSDANMFLNIDRARVRADKWFNDHTDKSSDRSFDDCECPKCREKPRQSNRVVPPKIPLVSSVEEAIKQVDDGILKEIAHTYRGTEHWRKLRTVYCQRQTLYAEYQRHGCDLNQMLYFHFKDETGARSYNILLRRIQNWNALNH